MKVLNYGSLNLDNVYTLDHMVQEGETILSSKLEVFCGGKGLNQSVALARAGVPVFHAGQVGEDGQMLLDLCDQYGVDTTYVRMLPVKGGHTVIQVDRNGQNSIILYGGTNQMQTKEYIDEVLANFEQGDLLLLQNEVNLLDYVIDQAYARGMKIVLNPSPFDAHLDACDLNKVWLFLLNEVEGEQMTGSQDPDRILSVLHEKYPDARIVLTLGVRGAWYYDGQEKVFQDVFPVTAVDTTAAGDTFTGFFVAGLIDGETPAQALRMAAKASSIAVTRPGAAPSVPTKEEVLESF